MKKFIWISIIYLLAFSCVNRSVDKLKTVSEMSENVKGSQESKSTEISESASSINLSSQEHGNYVKAEEMQSTGSAETESGSSKSQTENSTRKVTNRKYYPNGTLKSETETSENNSKALDEKNYYKSIYEETQRQNSVLTLENTKLKKENFEAVIRESKYKEDLKNYQSQLKKKDQHIAKSSEKKIPFASVVLGYIAVVIFFIAFVALLYFAWVCLKNSQWYLKIFNKVKKIL